MENHKCCKENAPASDKNAGAIKTASSNDSNKVSPWAVVVLLGLLLAGSMGYILGSKLPLGANSSGAEDEAHAGDATIDNAALAALQEEVLPSEGILLPITWDGYGKKLVDAGVIDMEQLESIYATRGGLGEDERDLLSAKSLKNVRMTQENANFMLNMLWAFGLANENQILEKGPMSDPEYGGADKFASTGGWTLAKGEPMDHFSAHKMITLTAAQQALVEEVAKNIYRPCCNNDTYFPDCNHGMAMLGLLEIMASQGATEEEMYTTALQVNSFWFPTQYLTLARYYTKYTGNEWEEASPKEYLGKVYSSGSGFQAIQNVVEPVQAKGGGSCGV